MLLVHPLILRRTLRASTHTPILPLRTQLGSMNPACFCWLFQNYPVQFLPGQVCFRLNLFTVAHPFDNMLRVFSKFSDMFMDPIKIVRPVQVDWCQNDAMTWSTDRCLIFESSFFTNSDLPTGVPTLVLLNRPYQTWFHGEPSQAGALSLPARVPCWKVPLVVLLALSVINSISY